MLNNFKGSKEKLKSLWNENEDIKNKIQDQINLRDQIFENVTLTLPNGTQGKVPRDFSVAFSSPVIIDVTRINFRFYVFTWELDFESITPQLLSYLQTNIIFKFNGLEMVINDPDSFGSLIDHPDLGGTSISEIIVQISEEKFIYKKSVIISQFTPNASNGETTEKVEDFQAKLNIKLMNPHIYY